MDKETEKFAAEVLESTRQMKRGEVGQVHTPEQITARRGRPAGSVAAVTKSPVKLRLDPARHAQCWRHRQTRRH
jgi:hypothetical protein